MTNRKLYGNIYKHENECECSSMVEFQPSKLVAWVRFPSLAPICALSSVDRVPGYEPVGRRFESSRARHKQKKTPLRCLFLLSCGVPLLSRTLHLHSKCEGSHTALRYLRSVAEHTLRGRALAVFFSVLWRAPVRIRALRVSACFGIATRGFISLNRVVVSTN